MQTALHPTVPAGVSTTYFLELTLTDHGRVIDRNVYWLSTKPDQIDFDNTIGEGSGAEFVPGGYADLTGLQQLASADVRAGAHSHRDGSDVVTTVTTVTIRNVSHRPTVGFLLRADVRRSTGGDNQVLPIRWSQNDVTLWPGESQTITARYAASELRGTAPKVTITGWNTPTTTIPG